MHSKLSSAVASRHVQIRYIFVHRPVLPSRPAPPHVEPIDHEGVRYEQDRHDGGDGDQPGGYLAAIDIQSGKRLWRIKVYTVADQPLGVPVFARYFRAMKLSADQAALDIESEGGAVYRVDLGTCVSTWVSGSPRRRRESRSSRRGRCPDMQQLRPRD